MIKGMQISRIKRTGNKLFLLLLVMNCLLLSGKASAAEIIGKFSNIAGRVDVLRDGRLPSIAAEIGVHVSVNDIIRTKSGSKAEITFNNGNVLRIGQKSRIDISEYQSGRKSSIYLHDGKIEAIVTKAKRVFVSGGNRFEIKTINAVAGVRGTDYFVSYAGNITEVFVKEGEVAVHNIKFPDAQIVVGAGNITVVEPHKPPSTPEPALPEKIKEYEEDVSSWKKSESKSEAQTTLLPQDELMRFTGCSK